MQKYDLIVIGGGPGGYAAAIRAAQLGAKVALIEKDKVGGTCLTRGCIPTKAIIACTNLYEQIQKAENFGIAAGQPALDLKKVIERKDKIIAKIVKGVGFLLEKNRVEVIYGTAKVLEAGKVEVTRPEGRKLSIVSCKLIIATGSSPAAIPGVTLDGKKFFSSETALNCTEAPEKLDIVGGGVIGLHFAQIFSALGTEITIYEVLPEILPGVDEEVVALVKRLLKRKKINIITNICFDSAQSCGKTLICVGRTPNLAGLEALNLKMDKRSVWVNEKMETSVSGVYAAGDLVSRKMLAHVAYEQGVIAAENAMGSNKTFTYDNIPFGIYTHPEIGSVGLTEKEAREKFGEVKVGKFPYAALGIAQAMGEIEGFIKVIADAQGKLLGVHILGAEATSLVGAVALAAKQGLSIEQLAASFQAHPTYPEGLHEAALSVLKQSLHGIN
ncbi:dihydrolipoyl dehydrogenase [candidate division WOR-1 bacterium RIFCSPLOWO2_02_FULL_46_20]|uniref:Dihydrolipoyl dehydrogenase n=2 Tax=Saganbacteria TaxID=1703751 RepID=A0A1F4RGB7_UNCSA|nr:MAG: dihydrolipoyl dehydrogenase [candidate division WOR-1 bacterium RIFCSPLOWO2_02_FULL_46_20]OGC09956.1 MAG: dihydrolipoyl dehydrogenase [candidate division WOR-1 bacterium RIFCSPLOWO2_12_FULL_45_9]